MINLNNVKDLTREDPAEYKNNGLLNVPRACMQLAGMWPTEQIRNKQRRTMFFIYKCFVLTYYSIFNVLLIIECVRLILQKKEFERISTACGISVTLTSLVMKTVIFNKNRIPQNLLIAFETEKHIWATKDDDLISLYKLILKYCRYINFCVITFAICTVGFFYIINFAGSEGIISIGIENWNFDNRAFMHEVYFPFDKKKYFYLLFAMNMVFSIYSIILYVTCLCVICAYIIFAILLLMRLQIRLEKLHLISREAQVDCFVIMKRFIKEHQYLIGLVRTLNDSVRYVLLMDFLLNSFKVAFNLFQVVTCQSLSELFFPLIYALMITWEVCSMGWISNEIYVQSLAIANAAYKSLWYKQDARTNRLLNIIIMRAQRPLVLTIGPFQPMTTETIVTILKAAYSYVTLMTDN